MASRGTFPSVCVCVYVYVSVCVFVFVGRQAKGGFRGSSG